MARHRSPGGRRAHLGPPLPAVLAAAGAGAHRSLPLPTPSPTRLIAALIAGGALAGAAHAALPMAADGVDVLRVGTQELLGLGPGQSPTVPAALTTASPATAVGAAPQPSVTPVVPEPVVADAVGLVKAAELQRRAAEAAAQAAEAERVARAAEAERAGAASSAGGVQMLVGRVTSGFGARWGSQHMGLDIAAPIGTPIRVPLDGVVIDSGPASGFGLWVRVRHDDGTITVYGHINRSLVSKGDPVSAGQVIAEVGNRGRSTGPHLHMEVIDPGGRKVNPRPWLDERGIGY